MWNSECGYTEYRKEGVIDIGEYIYEMVQDGYGEGHEGEHAS